MTKDKIFVVIEGLSGSGKSTVAQILTEKLDGIYLKPPEAPFNAIRGDVDQTCDAQTRFLFYLTGLSHVSHQIKELKKTRAVVLDKYIDTTVLFPKSKGYDFEIPLNITLEKPDYIFYLEIIDNIRLERLKKRDEAWAKNRSPEMLIREQKIKQLFQEKKYIHFIDNSKTLSDTINQILNIMGSDVLPL